MYGDKGGSGMEALNRAFASACSLVNNNHLIITNAQFGCNTMQILAVDTSITEEQMHRLATVGLHALQTTEKRKTDKRT